MLTRKRSAGSSGLEENSDISEDYALDHGVVHVADKPVVHREVPQPPVFTHIFAVPPLFIELAVSEVGKLGQNVHEELEEGEKADNPAGGIRQC